jgi:hypothetical protein
LTTLPRKKTAPKSVAVVSIGETEQAFARHLSPNVAETAGKMVEGQEKHRRSHTQGRAVSTGTQHTGERSHRRLDPSCRGERPKPPPPHPRQRLASNGLAPGVVADHLNAVAPRPPRALPRPDPGAAGQGRARRPRRRRPRARATRGDPSGGGEEEGGRGGGSGGG